jgi:hypothetical protein
MSPNLRWAWVTATRRAGHCALLILEALIIQGCAATPQRPLAGSNPADPGVRVPATSYRPALRDFHRVPPNEPGPWSGGDAMPESKKEKP